MRNESRENFRKVADMLSHQFRTQGLQSVLFTAPKPRSGTTTSAVGVAQELQSLAGLRTLLVDLNLRNPGVANRVKASPKRTLADLSLGTATLADCVETTPGGLAILAAPAKGALEPSAGLVQRILDGAKGSFDFVLFDTPPVLGYADATVAGGPVPRVVLVVEAGQTSYEVIDRIKRELSVRGIGVLGAILNKHRRFIPGWIYRLFAR